MRGFTSKPIDATMIFMGWTIPKAKSHKPQKDTKRKHMTFANLKNQSKLGSLTEKLVKEVEKMNTSSGNSDDRFWKPTLGKEGVGSAVIRFLPAPEGEDLPWAKLYTHAFQGVNGWYIENSLTTINQKDPVSDYNRALVMANSSDGKLDSCPKKIQDTVRNQKRKLSYYANIYVVKDPANPENDGKVFLFKFGKKIFDKILSVMQPEFEDETPINPFDFWQGANFKMKIMKKDGYWNYDRSEFDSLRPLLDDDDALEAIWKKEYSLTAVTAPDQFKTYEDLEKRMNFVLGLNQKSSPTQSRQVMEQESELESYSESSNSEDRIMRDLEQSYSRAKASTPSTTETDDDDEADEALQYFQRLADA